MECGDGYTHFTWEKLQLVCCEQTAMGSCQVTQSLVCAIPFLPLTFQFAVSQKTWKNIARPGLPRGGVDSSGTATLSFVARALAKVRVAWTKTSQQPWIQHRFGIRKPHRERRTKDFWDQRLLYYDSQEPKVCWTKNSQWRDTESVSEQFSRMYRMSPCRLAMISAHGAGLRERDQLKNWNHTQHGTANSKLKHQLDILGQRKFCVHAFYMVL